MFVRATASLLPLLICLASSRPTPNVPRQLSFSPRGDFKIAVFTDLHYGEAEDLDWGPQQDVDSTRVMNGVLDDEKPDFVVFNGDQITGENTYSSNSTRYLDLVFSAVASHKTPFATIYGNHDNAPNISHTAEYEYERAHYAGLSYTQANPSSAKDANGQFNYVVPVLGKPKDRKPALLLWFFDSRSGIFDSPSQYEDWVDPAVASWLSQTQADLKTQYGDDTLPPSMAFVHIPPKAAVSIQAATVDPNPAQYGLNEDRPVDPQGQHHPEVDSPDAPFWNALTSLGDSLIATVVGHDHGDNWCADSADVPFTVCFARHTGYGGYGSWARGSRIFSFSTKKNPSGKPLLKSRQGTFTKPPKEGKTLNVRSWMRMEDHSTANATVLRA